jgi:hypothetical protein
MRPADKIAGMPIRQRDLAAGRRGVEAADQPRLDDDDSILVMALREQRLRPRKLPRGTNTTYAIPIVRQQALDEALRPSEQRLVFCEQDTRDGGIENAFALMHIWQASPTYPAMEDYSAAGAKPTSTECISHTPARTKSD